MRFCCLFHSKKRYAYQVGTYAGSYVVQRVLVRECDICHSQKIKNFDCLSKQYQSFFCQTTEEVIEISRINGTPLLGKVI